MTEASYQGKCGQCGYVLGEEAYRAAEHLVHQCGGDEVGCPRCGESDWTFEAVADRGQHPEGYPKDQRCQDEA